MADPRCTNGRGYRRRPRLPRAADPADSQAMWDLLRCAHIGPCVAVTVIASMLALAGGRGAGTVWVASAVFAGQLSIGWANDWLDEGRDRAAGRTDKPVVTGAVAAQTLRAAALVALAACAVLSLASGPAAAAVHLLAVGFGWAYDLGLKRTAASVVPFVAAFGLLPAFVALGLDAGRLPPWWIVVGGGLLGAAAHLTNAIPDLEVDARTGVRGLPQRLGAGRSLAASAVLRAAAGAVVVAGPAGRPGPGSTAAAAVGGGLVCGVVAAGARDRPRAAFRLTMGAALAVTVALVASGGRLG